MADLSDVQRIAIQLNNAYGYSPKLNSTAASMLIELGHKLERAELRLDAAIADINMCGPCKVCTRSCKYDKVNPYDECADFEWRSLAEVKTEIGHRKKEDQAQT